jgi:hypothetical protein
MSFPCTGNYNADQVKLLSRSFQYFKENDSFNINTSHNAVKRDILNHF